jgi:GT2 family glycosyltransferase
MFSRYSKSIRKATTTSLSLIATNSGNGRTLCLVSDSAERTSPSPHELAAKFAADGWKVTFLDLAPDCKPLTASYTHLGLAGLYQNRYWYTPLRALALYQWLSRQSFTTVVFHQDFGAGYFCCVGRDLGLAFQNMKFLVCASTPHAKTLEDSYRLPSGRTDIERDCLERETFARADGAISTDASVLRWLEAADWTFPTACALLDEKVGLSFGQWVTSLSLKTFSPLLAADKISISVCIASYNRPTELRSAIDSLLIQTVPVFEVVIVDDGSTDPEMELLRHDMRALFQQRGWRWEKQANSGPSVARNQAAKLSRGSHLLFMDDDNLALPDEIELFAKAAQSGLDILTCVSGWHEKSDFNLPPIMVLPPREPGGAPNPVTWIPVGAHLMLTMFTNPFGDTNALYRREVFKALGGFQGSRDMVFEDFELFTRAVIAGKTLAVIPEVLFLYRRHKASRSMGKTIFLSHVESLRPVAELLPPALRPLLLALRNDFYSRHRALSEER